MYRSFVDLPLTLGDKILLPKEELHHIKKVLRAQLGEKVELVNGRGDLAICELQESLQILSVSHQEPPTHKKILAIAHPLQTHLEFIVEKGTELGITHFCLFPSSKSPISDYSPAKKYRLNKIAIAALKQCKRLYLPQIAYLNASKLPPATYFLGDPKGAPYPSTTPPTDVGFIIGPESGFSKEELAQFQNLYKATPIKLSDNILRCETAAIVSSFLLSFPK